MFLFLVQTFNRIHGNGFSGLPGDHQYHKQQTYGKGCRENPPFQRGFVGKCFKPEIDEIIR